MELKEEWLMGKRKDIAFQVLDQHMILQTNHLVFHGVLLVSLKFLMNPEIVRVFTDVLLDINLLHFLDADIMNHHEGHLLSMRLFLVFTRS